VGQQDDPVAAVLEAVGVLDKDPGAAPHIGPGHEQEDGQVSRAFPSLSARSSDAFARQLTTRNPLVVPHSGDGVRLDGASGGWDDRHDDLSATG